jgi:hypothetical protein
MMFYLIYHGPSWTTSRCSTSPSDTSTWVHPWMGHVYGGIAAWCPINYSSTASARSARPARGRTG